MITLQMPPSAAKPAQPAATTAQANTSGAANPAATDSDPAVAPKESSAFALLLAQQTAATGPGSDKALAAAEAGDEDAVAVADAKAGDPAAAAPWMWLNAALPREMPGTAQKSSAGATESALDAAAGSGAATAATPGAANAQALAATTEAAPGQTTGVTHKNAADELSTLAATAAPAPQQHGAEIPPPPPQVQNTNQTAQAAAAPKLAPVEVPIESKVGTPRWTRDIHQSVSMLVQARTSVAELRLTPADMGPIQIRIDFSEKQPSVSISVQQTDTRNALDAALPRLRDMMAESGITLGGAGVEQHGRPGDAPGEQARFAWQGHDESAPPPAVADPLIPAARAIALNQLVDTYA